MEQSEVKQREASIVLVGQFDPLMMTPHWFVKNGMIPQEDVDENLAIELVYKELTKFSLANVLVEIQQGSVTLRSDHKSFDYKLHDLALGILTSVKNPEVSALGLNLYTDVHFESLDYWHRIGDIITPKDIWTRAFPESPKVGMASAQMQLKKPEGELGVYNFTVSWLEVPKAIRFSLNNHFDNKPLKKSTASQNRKTSSSNLFDPVAIVSACWEQSLEFHNQLVNSLLAQAGQE